MMFHAEATVLKPIGSKAITMKQAQRQQKLVHVTERVLVFKKFTTLARFHAPCAKGC